MKGIKIYHFTYESGNKIWHYLSEDLVKIKMEYERIITSKNEGTKNISDIKILDSKNLNVF